MQKTLKILSILLVAVLLLTMIVACGDDGDNEEETPISNTTPVASPTTPVASPTIPPASPTTPTASPTQKPEAKLSGTLTIFHAGSLAVPFSEMEAEFESLYPNVDVQCESASSGVTIRKVTELERDAEIIASADYRLIPQLMYPDYADWYAAFSKNQMVLCYTDQSKYADEITSDNWYEILLRDGVEYAHSDLLDPCGYRTLLVWQLAEQYYNHPGLYAQLVANCPEKNIRPKSVELVALLQSGDIDYAYEYISVAMQHGLNYIQFPPNIDLSDVAFEDFYATSTVDIPGTEPGQTIAQIGTPIVYATTIPTNTEHPDLALAFMKYLLGEKGQAIMNKSGQPSIVPALTDNLSKMPEELQALAVQIAAAP